MNIKLLENIDQNIFIIFYYQFLQFLSTFNIFSSNKLSEYFYLSKYTDKKLSRLHLVPSGAILIKNNGKSLLFCIIPREFSTQY